MNWQFWKRPVQAYSASAITAYNAAVNSITRRLSAAGIYGHSPDGNRDYNTTFGYPEEFTYELAYEMYRRGGIAHTVVTILPKACWRDVPALKDADEEIIPWLKKKNAFAYLERADILNRIGRFSVLLVGVPDGLPLDHPLGSATDREGVYFMPYSYAGTEIIEWDEEATSPRLGLPRMYQLRTVNLGDKEKVTSFKSVKVHWSRIVHLAEGALDSDVEGMSALEPPCNALLDRDKVRGSSSEATHRNSRRVFALEAEGNARIDMSKEGKAAFQEEISDFNDGHQDFMRLQGVKAKVMQPGLESPRDAYDIAVEDVAGTTGIAVRLLTGRGVGTLAGAEDRASFNSLTSSRQNSWGTLWFTGMLQIFENCGLIKLPQSLEIVWPPPRALNETEASEVTERKSKAFERVTAGLSSIAGDTLDAQTVFEEVGLKGIKDE